jgi:hypothetical protein
MHSLHFPSMHVRVDASANVYEPLPNEPGNHEK